MTIVVKWGGYQGKILLLNPISTDIPILLNHSPTQLLNQTPAIGCTHPGVVGRSTGIIVFEPVVKDGKGEFVVNQMTQGVLENAGDGNEFSLGIEVIYRLNDGNHLLFPRAKRREKVRRIDLLGVFNFKLKDIYFRLRHSFLL